MDTVAVVLETPENLSLLVLPLILSASDALVQVDYSSISTGTEKLLWSGRMPNFPGMGYPLVPGYETVGHIVSAPADSGLREGDCVFVPGASCYEGARGLFGGAAKTIATKPERLIKVDAALGENATLLALAATAHHAATHASLPDLIVGHGVLGRLIARVTCALGGAPTVWEAQTHRCTDEAYSVIIPASDTRRDYRCICDASGDGLILNRVMPHLAKGGEIVLAGFYSDQMSFSFAPAFMREAAIKIAAEWHRADMDAVLGLVATGALSLDGLITHRSDARDAPEAYRTAFTDPACLKMSLDWRSLQ